MRKVGVIFVLMFFTILLLNNISAQPPFEPVVLDAGLQIDFPQINLLPLDQEYTFNFHPSNSTSGVRLDNTTIWCVYELINQSGIHTITELNMTWDLGGLDFEITVAEGNFSDPGIISYIVYCEDSSSSVGGTITVGLELSPEGSTSDVFKILSYTFLTLILLVLAIGFFYVTSRVDYDKWNNKIQAKYAGRDKVKAVLASIAFNFAKESFMTLYILFLPVVLMFRDITILARIDSILLIINAFAVIYSIGMLIIVALFIGKIQSFIVSMVELTKNQNWGIGPVKND